MELSFDGFENYQNPLRSVLEEYRSTWLAPIRTSVHSDSNLNAFIEEAFQHGTLSKQCPHAFYTVNTLSHNSFLLQSSQVMIMTMYCTYCGYSKPVLKDNSNGFSCACNKRKAKQLCQLKVEYAPDNLLTVPISNAIGADAKIRSCRKSRNQRYHKVSKQ
nr:hypothetical protein HmN_000680100 [Hymenolepis microstoma]